MTKNEAARYCYEQKHAGKCGGCEFELIEQRGLTKGVNDECVVAKTVWLSKKAGTNKPRAAVGPRKYDVYYLAKFNSQQKVFVIEVESATSKEACAECKRLVAENTGRNAFGPKAYLASSGKKPDYVSHAIPGYPPHK